jgi:hypothetical protein
MFFPAMALSRPTYTIEQYRKRRFFMKNILSVSSLPGIYFYPVREALAVYVLYHTTGPELVEPEFYSLCPEIEERLDIPHALRLSRTLGWLMGLTDFKAVYRVGIGRVKPHLIWPRSVWNWRSGT